jgi:pimeloyl-ACP methyl ester carboxylesterase
MPPLQSQSYVFDARPHYPLLVSVKRYWVPGFESTDDDAVTLVLAHATSFHKELWEPFLQELYAQAAASSATGSPLVKIRDAWAIDCPNHGESAMLNEETLLCGYTPICKSYAGPYGSITQTKCGNLHGTVSWEEYARAIHLILNGFGKGIGIDFKSRNLVGVGHSMGTAAMSALNIIPLCDPSTHLLSQNPNQDNVSICLMVCRDSDRAYVYPSGLFWGSKQVPDGGRRQAS